MTEQKEYIEKGLQEIKTNEEEKQKQIKEQQEKQQQQQQQLDKEKEKLLSLDDNKDKPYYFNKSSFINKISLSDNIANNKYNDFISNISNDILKLCLTTGDKKIEIYTYTKCNNLQEFSENININNDEIIKNEKIEEAKTLLLGTNENRGDTQDKLYKFYNENMNNIEISSFYDGLNNKIIKYEK